MDVELHAADKPDVVDVDRTALPMRSTSAALSDGATAFDVVIPKAAWEQMQRHAHVRLDVEVGGVLIGKVVASDDGKAYLLIEGGIPALAAESRETNITFTAEAWTRIHETIDRKRPGAVIVGWYHTHPSFGIFLSEMDVFIQRHFFDLPHQVAIVIDPVANTHGSFIWRAGVPTLGPLHIEGSETAAPITKVSDHASPAPTKAWKQSRSPIKFVRARLGALIAPVIRLELSQWAALMTLLALAGVLFGALAMLLLNAKPSDLLDRLTSGATTQPGGVTR